MIPDIAPQMTGYWMWRICTEKPREEALRILTEEYSFSEEDAEKVYQENIHRGKKKNDL